MHVCSRDVCSRLSQTAVDVKLKLACSLAHLNNYHVTVEMDGKAVVDDAVSTSSVATVLSDAKFVTQMQSSQTPAADAAPASAAKTDCRLLQYEVTAKEKSGKRFRGACGIKVIKVDDAWLEQSHLKDGEMFRLQRKKKDGSTEYLLAKLVDGNSDGELGPISARKRKKGV